MELLDIVDENGCPTGGTVEREIAHREGIRHRTAHVWLMRMGRDGAEVLLQKRSADKDSHPGCYDISSAGHIPAGVDFIPSALRELQEELGLTADGSELVYCGQRRFYFAAEFHGKPFIDHQVSNVYCIWRDVAPENLVLQESEVESVRWMNLEECKAAVREKRIHNCIFLEELEMLPKEKEQSRLDNAALQSVY